eukprot:TRINITY_DN2623_c0_g3_i5.p1 TRINITY_DN2623_c0_g3~~TRINITY_DN2623_c0_g3_i5.p1  ORF type:complete len:737 (+),score=101.84 TRINITY_DN2623_c0_g3_i5:160-2370(+)
MTERQSCNKSESRSYSAERGPKLPSWSSFLLGHTYEEHRSENEVNALWKKLRKTSDYTLNGQQLSSFPKDFDHKHFYLKSVDLSYNSFREIPTELFSLSHLQVLKMNFNMINAIPSNVGSFKELEVFSIANNFIYYVNPSIEKLRKLTVLILNNNSLEEWPVINIPSLRILHLHNNPNISGIPLAFRRLTNLKDLTFDWFQYLPPDWSKSASSEKLLAELRKFCAVLARKKSGAICTFAALVEYLVASKQHWQEQVKPLHLAAKKLHNEVILKEFIRLGNVNLKDENGNSPLVVAVKERNREGTKLLLQSPLTDVNCSIPGEGSIFNILLRHSWNEVAATVLSHPSFRPNYQDCLGNSPLHGLFDFCLLDYKDSSRLFNKLLSFPDCALNLRNNKDLAPLHLAVMKNRLVFVKLALDHNNSSDQRKFDFNSVERYNGSSILHMAALYASIELVDELLSTDVQLFLKDRLRKIPRELAKNSAIRKLLLKHEMHILRNRDDYIITEHSKDLDTVCFPVIPPESENAASQLTTQENAKKNYKNKLVPSDLKKGNQRSHASYDIFSEEEEFENAENEQVATLSEDVLNQVKITREQLVLMRSKYSELYEMIMNKSYKRAHRCRALYHLFKQSNDDARDIMELVGHKMPFDDDVSYLNELQKYLEANKITIIDKNEQIGKLALPQRASTIQGRLNVKRTNAIPKSLVKSQSPSSNTSHRLSRFIFLHRNKPCGKDFYLAIN